MFTNLKYRLTTGWDFFRGLRAAFALFILTVSFIEHDTLLMLGGIFLTGQTMLNVGCCGANGCDVYPEPKRVKAKTKDHVVYEEIKEK